MSRKNLIVREKKNDKGEIFREFSLRDEHSYMIGLNNGIEKGKLEELIKVKAMEKYCKEKELEFLIELEIKIKYFVENKTIKTIEHHTLRDVNFEELNPNWLDVLSIVQCRIKQLSKEIGGNKK